MREDGNGPSDAVHASASRGPSSVKALILAAGRGQRLGRPTPKALLEFDGRTLLERHVSALQAHGIHDISITVGYRSRAIRSEIARLAVPHGVVLVDNPRYLEGSLV